MRIGRPHIRYIITRIATYLPIASVILPGWYLLVPSFLPRYEKTTIKLEKKQELQRPELVIGFYPLQELFI